MFKRVLLCYDGSAAGRRALRRGAELAILLSAQVHVLSINPMGAADPVLAAGAAGTACLAGDGFRRMLEESLQWLRARGVEATGYLASGDTIDEILTYTKKLGIELIVLGHYPQPTGGFWWSGKNSRGSLAERANCCVLVAVDAPADPAQRARADEFSMPG